MTSLLEIQDVHAGYSGVPVLRDVSFSVPQGSITAILGPNGAGKTTTLHMVAGFVSPSQGSVTYEGKDISKISPDRRSRKGICLIPEGRGVFPSLTVKENLELQGARQKRGGSVDAALDVFPHLRDRLSQVAGSLSGGQQQMLALSRAFIVAPKLVLLDEVSMGLAPIVVDEIFSALDLLASRGISLVVVEQYVSQVLALAQNVVILNRGSVTYDGPPEGLDRDEIVSNYLGN